MSSYEEIVMKILLNNNISFQREKAFKDLQSGRLRFDFYLPKTKTLLEIQGEFHYKPIMGRLKLLKQKENDRRKKSYALAKGYALYCIPYWELSNLKEPEDLFSSNFLVKTKWHDDQNKPPKS